MQYIFLPRCVNAVFCVVEMTLSSTMSDTNTSSSSSISVVREVGRASEVIRAVVKEVEGIASSGNVAI